MIHFLPQMRDAPNCILVLTLRKPIESVASRTAPGGGTLTSRNDRFERTLYPEQVSGQLPGSRLGAGRWVKAALFAMALCAGGPSLAQDMVYEPINPSFGGNPFNSAHLLGIANAQNDFKDPASRSNSSQADIFARQLQSRLLSALSSQIVDAIFGENPQQQGTISFGGQTIDFFRDLDSVTLNITNDETGEVTEIVIPTFIEVN